MKYRDIKFERNSDKQSYDNYELSTRQIVRKNKRRWDKFYMSVLSGYLSGKYWDLLDGSDSDGEIIRVLYSSEEEDARPPILS